ncbi:MAG: hypothetical protein ACRDHW_10290, partial [Ktedonobacteraceae bacterium]
MAKRVNKSAQHAQSIAENAKKQAYDNLLKQLVENQADALLPLLFPDVRIERLEELNVEVLIPPRRTDRVYKAYLRQRDGREAAVILQVEIESGENGTMDTRLLVYHALLLDKYQLPVYSLIVYLFDVKGVTPPLIEAVGTEEILTFKYRTLPLFHQSAVSYMEQHAVPMYALLPVMEDTSDELLLKAIDEMVQWYGDNERVLRDELLCFRVLLERAQRLPEAEMLRVERRISMLDPLLEESRWFQQKVAEKVAKKMAEVEARSLAEGEARGLAEGEARGLAEGEARGETRG